MTALDAELIDDLRERLNEERETHMELLEQYGADPYDEEVKNLDVGNDGFADAAQATEARSEVLGQLDSARQRVQLIDQALEQMEQGTYGTCVECGDPIAPARLEVRPLAIRCVNCAS